MQAKRKKLGQGGVLNEKLEGSSLQGGASRKITTGLNVAGQLKKGCIRVRPEMAQGMVLDNHSSREEVARVKTSRYSYNQGKNQGINLKSQGVLLKA